MPNQSTTMDAKSPLSPIIFIDGSYFVFYRFHALLVWWKNAYPDTELGIPINNTLFVDKFRKTFADKFVGVARGVDLEGATTIVARDCPRPDIWRNAVYPQYKACRVHNELCAPFFKMVRDEGMFEKAGAYCQLGHPRLEADDCVALAVEHAAKSGRPIAIIASDKDYLQLLNHATLNIYTLSFKNIAHRASCSGNVECDLFCKIVAGDASDGIPPAILRCGKKTALRHFANQTAFGELLAKDPELAARVERNRTLVDFAQIPSPFAEEFRQSEGFGRLLILLQ